MKALKQSPVSKRTIVIVDDHPLVREGLRRTIDSQADLVVVGEASNGKDAVGVVKKCQPDLVLVDLSMPGRDGIDLTKQLWTECPKLLILVVSMHDESVYAERSLRAGARGYVMKSELPETLLSAIRRILAGEVAVSNSIVTQMTSKMSRGNSLSPMDLLSDRELEIFRLFGEGNPRSKVAGDLNLSVKTIETHRANIYNKLGLRGADDLRRHAVRWVLDANNAQRDEAAQ